MELVPILENLDDNQQFVNRPECEDTLGRIVDYYKIIGFNPPWVGYYALENDQVVGSAGFKGQPVNGKIEIAYATLQPFRQQGIGTEMCRQLVLIARSTDPSVTITARTLPEPNFSTRILQKNNFRLLGTVVDPKDGNVWEWAYVG